MLTTSFLCTRLWRRGAAKIITLLKGRFSFNSFVVFLERRCKLWSSVHLHTRTLSYCIIPQSAPIFFSFPLPVCLESNVISHQGFTVSKHCHHKWPSLYSSLDFFWVTFACQQKIHLFTLSHLFFFKQRTSQSISIPVCECCVFVLSLFVFIILAVFILAFFYLPAHVKQERHRIYHAQLSTVWESARDLGFQMIY